MDFPEFQTQRLTLSQLTEQDAASIFQLFSNPSVMTYYDMPVFTDVEQAQQFIERMRARFEAKAGIRWGIRLQTTGELIGTCGFNVWNPHTQAATVGYDLRPDYWGQGMVAEALHELVQRAFVGGLFDCALNRIQADTVPGNTQSEAVLKKVGFKEEGLRRECGYWQDQFHDLKCFGLLRREYQAP
ncbi:N-acetyltransferase [Bacterioplanes sanyensis]|uniref:GNAT family N-acetyltransferase n=1 Tax=Bacterioplanes sanyensis TaxID=1249553 RepID=UPI001676DB7A|nr:GNAT family N-acetyltransferase [Bacterioplanes sanyensis]GGY55839.1 N-acetyltransferase [Bacterioplanes sanyensis]